MRKRELIILCILLIVLVCIVLYVNRDKSNKNYVYIPNNEVLVIENALPLSDQVGSTFSRSNGKSNIYYKFKIKSNADKKCNYKILLKTNNGKKFIDDRYIKILLSDKDDNTLKDYNTDSVKVVTGLKKYDDKYIVHSGKIGKNGTDEFILRMWVSDAFVYDDKLIFDGKLSIYSY